MRLRTLFLVAVSLAALVGGLWYWGKSEESSARRLETWQHQERIDSTVAALDKRFEWPIKTIPLVDFSKVVAETTGLAVDIDRLAIESEGENLNSYQIDLPGGTLSAAGVLRLGLEPHDLCYDVDDRRLTITTLDASRDRNRLRTVVYPLPQPEPSAARVPVERWHELVTELVDVSGWDEVGGPAHCEAVPGALVVVQSEHVHRQIRKLIEIVGQLENPPQSLVPVLVSPFDDTPGGQDVWQKLNQPATLHCTNRPLELVLDDLAAQRGAPIRLNRRKLEEAGVNPAIEVSLNFERVSLASLLRLMLDELELTFYVRDGAVEVTTPEDAESPDNMVTIAYPVHDLVQTPFGHDFDQMIDLIETTIAPESWPDVGGPALIDEEVDGWLFILQTSDVHLQIEQLLTQIRQALAYGPQPVISGVPTPSPADQRIHEALGRTIPLRFAGIPLKEAVQSIGGELGIPTHISHRKLEENGSTDDERVTCLQTDRPVRERLRETLGPLHLSFVVHHEVLQITSPEDAESPENLRVRIYDARVLTDADLGVLGEDGVEDLLVEVLSSENWSRTGGPASIQYFRGLTVVAHTDDEHDRIERLLALVEKHCLQRLTEADEWPRVVELDSDPASARIERLLSQPLKLKLSANTPYVGVMQAAEHVGIPLVIKNECLPETLAPTLSIASVDGAELTLAGALERMLLPSSLAYVVQEGQLVVALAADAESRASIRLYRIDDLPVGTVDSTQTLIDRLRNETDAVAWHGKGVIRPVGKRWLCISASSRQHERVIDVLTELRTGKLPQREAERRKLKSELKAANDLRFEQETEALFNFRSSDPPRVEPKSPPADPFGP